MERDRKSFKSRSLQYIWIKGSGLLYRHIYSKSMDQPGKVANPARGQLDMENECFLVRVRA